MSPSGHLDVLHRCPFCPGTNSGIHDCSANMPQRQHPEPLLRLLQALNIAKDGLNEKLEHAHSF